MELVNNTDGRFLLSVQMIADALNELGWEYKPMLSGDVACFRELYFFDPAAEMRKDILYLVPKSLSSVFPSDIYSCISDGMISGTAPNIHQIQRPFLEIANVLMSVFHRYHEFESTLYHVVSGGGTLTDLCRVAESFFHNPIFIHDNMFVLIGYPRDIKTTTQFSRNSETGLLHIPMQRIDEFRFDPDYILTYQERHAGIWDKKSSVNSFRSLFVNLFDGDQLYGRLLINERQSALCPGQLKVAEYLAQYAMMIIRRDAQSTSRSTYSFQDTFTSLALGQAVPEHDYSAALAILRWHEEDRYLCARLCSQGSTPPLSPVIAVQSALSADLKSSFSFVYQGDICIIVNLSRSGSTPAQVSQILAACVRDNYLFCGISNPFLGLDVFPSAFRQASAALEYASRSSLGAWLVSFEKYALDYFEDITMKQLPMELLVAPQIQKLRSVDNEKSTEYCSTLRAFLYHACDIASTAKALIIHRTTLTYRLDRIRELIPLDLSDPNYRLYLQLSFHLLERMEKMQSEP